MKVLNSYEKGNKKYILYKRVYKVYFYIWEISVSNHNNIYVENET